MTYDMTELNRETRMGGLGTETTDREVRRIDLSDFENRRSEIAEELWSAATDIGFFQIVQSRDRSGPGPRGFRGGRAILCTAH